MKNLIILFFLLFVIGCKNNDPVDPCESITCINGGTCVNGQCDCPPMYTGPDCSNQKKPNRIQLNKVIVTSFPATDTNGAGWDIFDGADIFIEVQEEGTVIYSASTFYEDANPSIAYPFTISGNVYLDPDLKYSVVIYDYDDGISADDYMGGIEGKVYGDSNGFPSVIDFSCSGCTSSFKLEVKYEF